jgi:hypothetical protein
MEDSDCHVMPTTVAVTMAMTSTLMTTGCEKHMTLIATLIAMQAVLKYVQFLQFRMFIRNDSKLNKSDDLCERCK